MDYETNLGKKLKAWRRSKKWSQSDLSVLTGISRSRISNLENLHRWPGENEWTVLVQVLEQGSIHRKPRLLQRPYPGQVWRTKAPKLNRHHARPVQARFSAARKRYGSRVTAAINWLEYRARRELNDTFMAESMLDSGTEYFFWLSLIAIGARPAWIAPVKVGFRLFAILDSSDGRSVGDLRHPCLELQLSKIKCLLFPQVTVQTRSANYRLDALVKIRKGRRSKWVNLELDGLGHDPSFDEERRFRLGLPTVRLKDRDLMSGKISEILERNFLLEFVDREVR